MGLHALAVRVEVLADVIDVLFGSTEFTGADCATQDNDGHEEAEECDFSVANGSLDLPGSMSPHAPFQHLDSAESTRFSENSKTEASGF